MKATIKNIGILIIVIGILGAKYAKAQNLNVNGNLTAGYGNSASGYSSHGIGYSNNVAGSYGVSIGNYNSLVGAWNYTFGGGCTATSTANGATALGLYDVVSGYLSTAVGASNTASATSATAVGCNSTASGVNSTTLGCAVLSNCYDATVVGANNSTPLTLSGTSWVTTDPIFIVGNGASSSAKSNAMTVLKNGSILIHPQGDLSMGAYTSGTQP